MVDEEAQDRTPVDVERKISIGALRAGESKIERDRRAVQPVRCGPKNRRQREAVSAIGVLRAEELQTERGRRAVQPVRGGQKS